MGESVDVCSELEAVVLSVEYRAFETLRLVDKEYVPLELLALQTSHAKQAYRDARRSTVLGLSRADILAVLICRHCGGLDNCFTEARMPDRKRPAEFMVSNWNE